jgi:hypothetical protein
MNTTNKAEQRSSTGGMSLSVGEYAFARAVATSAGDLSIVVRNEVKKTLAANRNDILKSLTSGLSELVNRKLITAEKEDQLNTVFKHLLGSIRKKEDGENAFLAIRSVYHKLLTNQRSSPTALAIASVATSAFDLEKEESTYHYTLCHWCCCWRRSSDRGGNRRVSRRTFGCRTWRSYRRSSRCCNWVL